VDEAAHRAFVDDDELPLSAKEFALLALLAREAGRVITRERIMEEVWDEHWFGSTKTLDVTLGRLRAKLDPAAAGVRIAAVRGVGFRLEPADA
jgi:DNA-binding response OmpR family regulator